MLTVAICSNRYDRLLEQAIDKTLAQCVTLPCVRVLLVINASRDVLDGVNRYKATLPDRFSDRLDVAFEENSGLSHARNHAIRICQTSYLAFIDDDAYPANGWPARILDGFERHGADCVGGPCLSIWSSSCPSWVTDQVRLYFTHVDWGRSDLDLTKTPEKWLAGTNIAFSIEALRSIGGFPVELGRNGKSLLSAEETYAQMKLRDAGMTVWYCADAQVFHHVREDRISRRWVIKRAFNGGKSDRVCQSVLGKESASLKAARTLVGAPIQWVTGKSTLMEGLIQIAYGAGYLATTP